jgi:hypothetical protein
MFLGFYQFIEKQLYRLIFMKTHRWVNFTQSSAASLISSGENRCNLQGLVRIAANFTRCSEIRCKLYPVWWHILQVLPNLLRNALSFMRSGKKCWKFYLVWWKMLQVLPSQVRNTSSFTQSGEKHLKFYPVWWETLEVLPSPVRNAASFIQSGKKYCKFYPIQTKFVVLNWSCFEFGTVHC